MQRLHPAVSRTSTAGTKDVEIGGIAARVFRCPRSISQCANPGSQRPWSDRSAGGIVPRDVREPTDMRRTVTHDQCSSTVRRRHAPLTRSRIQPGSVGAASAIHATCWSGRTRTIPHPNRFFRSGRCKSRTVSGS